ncbi:TPA: hypothetical protein DIC40_00850 [Patescibacteria group bacterium]|nr:hypothetical protein [Candidatus Gracilibacteria bacterium]
MLFQVLAFIEQVQQDHKQDIVTGPSLELNQNVAVLFKTETPKLDKIGFVISLDTIVQLSHLFLNTVSQ